MKVQQLAEADYEMVFTKDPGYFFEAILVNLQFSDSAADAEKQKQLFLKWIGFYTNSVREQYSAEIRKESQEWAITQLYQMRLEGQLYALTHLPFTPNLLGKDKLDMLKLNARIHELKVLTNDKELDI